jgi:peptide/nickel transport system substrate-binding protein
VKLAVLSPTRRALLGGVGVTALGGLAVMLRPSADSQHDRTAERTLRVVGPWELTGLEPSRAGYMFTRLEISETLFGCDVAGRISGALAQRWEHRDDGRVLRIELHPERRFHDGSAVDADAVKQCLERVRLQPGLLGRSPLRVIHVRDAHRLDLELDQPYGLLPAVLSHYSTQILAPSAYAQDGRVRTLIGTGPYRVERIEGSSYLKAVLAESWTGERPMIASLEYLAVGRAESRALMAESGEADLVFGLDAPSVARMRRAGHRGLLSAVLPRTLYLKVNAGHRWLQDLRVRRALSLALDRRGIATAVMRDTLLATDRLLPMNFRDWHAQHDKDDGLPVQDIEGARALLAEAGWQPGDDGVLTRLYEGRRERLTLALITFPDRPELPVIAAAIQEQFRQIGVALSVSIGNSGDVPLAHHQGSLELALLARNFALVPDPLLTLLQDYGTGGGDWGAMNWGDRELEAALVYLQQRLMDNEGAAVGDDVRERRHVIARRLAESLPVIPLCGYRAHALAGARVAGAQLDPFERSYLVSRMRWA